MGNISFRENIDLAKTLYPTLKQKFPSRDEEFYILSIIKGVLICVSLPILFIVFILWSAFVEITFVLLIKLISKTCRFSNFCFEVYYSRYRGNEVASTPKTEEKLPESDPKSEPGDIGSNETIPNERTCRQTNRRFTKGPCGLDSKESEDIEKEKRKKNLVFFGIPEEDEEETQEDLKEKILRILEEKFGNNSLNLSNVHRQGNCNRSEKGRPRPVVVTFDKLEDRSYIMKNSNKLKNSNMFVQPDLILRDQFINRKLYAIKKQKEKEGHEVKLIGTQLMIDGKVFTLKE